MLPVQIRLSTYASHNLLFGMSLFQKIREKVKNKLNYSQKMKSFALI